MRALNQYWRAVIWMKSHDAGVVIGLAPATWQEAGAGRWLWTYYQ
jgi:hypothetical protein